MEVLAATPQRKDDTSLGTGVMKTHIPSREDGRTRLSYWIAETEFQAAQQDGLGEKPAHVIIKRRDDEHAKARKSAA